MNLFRINFRISKIDLKINRLMKECNLCHKPDKTHYRVKSIIHKHWIFCCKECWNQISTQKNYSYGGTRKLK